jgi:hypothetical protein
MQATGQPGGDRGWEPLLEVHPAEQLSELPYHDEDDR